MEVFIAQDQVLWVEAQVDFGEVWVVIGGVRTKCFLFVFWLAHSGFDAFYCQPGIDGAHEKGGVEGAVGWFRRNHLTPMPDVADLDELNARILEWEAVDDQRVISGRTEPVGTEFAREVPLLTPLPAEGFDPGTVPTRGWTAPPWSPCGW